MEKSDTSIDGVSGQDDAATSGEGNTAIQKTDGNLDCINTLLIRRDLQCSDLYEPVCGCNDITYRNKCEAKKAGVRTYKRGKCVKTAKM